MSNKLKLKRINDLFSEGDMCYLGDDETGVPVCVWVNKPNSIEEEEARLDGQAGRMEILMALSDPSHPEMQHAHMLIEKMTDDELYATAVSQNADQMLAMASLDVDADKEWTDKLDYLRRQNELLDDAKVSEDDPRRAEYAKVNGEYIDAVEAYYEKRKEAKLEEYKAKGRKEVEDLFIEDIKDRLSLDHYMLERRITQMFYASRECDATGDEGRKNFDHSKCDHSKRLFAERVEVRELPENVLGKINDKFEAILVGVRNVSNFPEPQNSSDSSAPPSI